VAQANQCQYCLSAHTLIGKGAGLSDDAIRDARAGKSSDPQDHAIAVLASKLLKQQGNLSQAELNTAHAAGIDEGLVLEIVVNVAFNVLTNYTNHVAETDIDFPVVQMVL
jgi:AhpD family alkylhydroperoxidase